MIGILYLKTDYPMGYCMRIHKFQAVIASIFAMWRFCAETR